MELPQEYFDNKAEQSKIKQAVLECLPTEVYYHNIIIALAEMLAQFTKDAFKDDVFRKSPKQKVKK